MHICSLHFNYIPIPKIMNHSEFHFFASFVDEQKRTEKHMGYIEKPNTGRSQKVKSF